MTDKSPQKLIAECLSVIETARKNTAADIETLLLIEKYLLLLKLSLIKSNKTATKQKNYPQPLANKKPKPDTVADEILMILKSHGELTTRQVFGHLSGAVSYRTLRRYLSELSSDKKIVKRVKDFNSTFYRLP